jgi:hypothetical protein
MTLSKWSPWDKSADPTENGWYAVVLMYDPCEGAFLSAWYWEGKWGTTAVIGWNGPFESRELAEKFGYDNDPEL